MNSDSTLYQDLDCILVTEEQLRSKVRELGEQITRDYRGKQLVAICILKGAVVFFADLIRQIQLDLCIDFMAIASYGSTTKSSGVVKLVKDLDYDISGKDVLIVEDIVDSGMSLTYIKQVLANRGASSVRIATLLDKPARRRTPLQVNYTGFEIPNEFVVGYGLDYDQKYRNLPVIGVLSRRIYEH